MFKTSKWKIYFSFAVLILLAIFFAAFIFWWRSYQATTFVTFLDVGEGDAILISQGSNQILIDGGRRGKDLLARLGRQMPFWDRTIETVIATHPDADHIGGFASLMAAYDVNEFLYTGAESDTETFSLLKKIIKEKNVNMLKVFRGGDIKFPRGGELAIEYPLAPLPAEAKETNTGSIVSRFTYGETEILLTGDLPSEETVLPDIKPANILKAAHHGSKYSTSADFLDLLKPKEAVISVGKNSYGHPSPDVLERLKERNTIIRRTDTDGDISYRCTSELVSCVLAR
jgi:competence protein ComEC